MNVIPLKDCKDGYLYIIAARNAYIGIFNKEKKGFRISRFKFDRNYGFTEYHWDIGEPCGTAKPYRELFKPEGTESEEAFLRFMNAYYDEHRKEILDIIKQEDDEYGPILKAKEKWMMQEDLHTDDETTT